MITINTRGYRHGYPHVCPRGEESSEKINHWLNPTFGSQKGIQARLPDSSGSSPYPRSILTFICSFPWTVCGVTSTYLAWLGRLAGWLFLFLSLGKAWVHNWKAFEKISGSSDPAIWGGDLDFYFLSTLYLGGKRSSHFAPMMRLNCPLDLFQSEKKQQRLQFLCCSCSF